MKNKIIYYDSFDDDFAGTNIDTNHVDETFPFTNDNSVWNAAAWVLYYVIGRPIAWTIMKVGYGMKVENKKAFSLLKDKGYFLYGNHTQILDVFVPPTASGFKRCNFVAGPDVVSIKGIRQLVLMLGAIPIPDTLHGMKKFTEVIERRYNEKRCIVVYPEAHIWPYYNGIRPFAATSFSYPAKLHSPIIAVTTTYRKRTGITSFIKSPALTICVSDPFYPKDDFSHKENAKYLRDEVYDFMCSKANTPNNYEYIRYEQRNKDN